MSNLKSIIYEVIADYPASMYSVGDIIKVYKSNCMAYIVEIDENSEKHDLRDYPHLFREVGEL